MAISKYMCRCGNKTDKLTSHFINNIRVTVCDECGVDLKNNKEAVAVDYDDVKKDPSKQIIDTREK